MTQLVLSEAQNVQKTNCPGLFHWKHKGKIIGTLYILIRPDGTIHALPPAIQPNEPDESLRLIYDKLVSLAKENGCPVVVILADKTQEINRTICFEAGFRKISNLLYLVSYQKDFSQSFLTKKLHFSPYKDSAWEQMVETVEKTYMGTLDFPSFNGISATHEILRGYIESHPFRPELWFFIKIHRKIIGALLLTQLEKDILELTYLGLFPEFRGKKLSHEIVQFAQTTMLQQNAKQLLVSVDAQNKPALLSYQRAGFQIYDSKKIFARFFQIISPISQAASYD